MNIRRKITLTIFTFLFIGIGFISAQTTGKISGKVIEESTGQPMPGVNVIIEGTSWGAATNINGEYFIINIPPGKYNVRFKMVGFETVKVEDVSVSVNRTTNIDIELKEAVIVGEEVVITADKITSKKDQTGSIRNVSADQIEALPVENMQSVVNMQAGVVQGHFRGGRRDEVSYMIDGMQVDESFGKTSQSVNVENDVVQEIEVITGTFNAEYGNAMSGIVNAVTKDGSDKFRGSIAINEGNYITSNDDVFVGLENDDFTRNQDYKLFLSGPILRNRIGFVFNTRYQDNKGHLNGIRRFKVDDYSNFRELDPDNWYSEHKGDGDFVPMSWSKNLSIFGKLSFNLFTGFRASLTYTRNDDESQGYNHFYKYNPDGMSTYHRESNMFAFQVNHTLSNSFFYEFKASYIDNYQGDYVYEDPTDSRYVHDEFYRSEGPGFLTGGQDKGHLKRTTKDLNIKFDATWQFNQNHIIKSGFVVKFHEIDNQSASIRNKYFGTNEQSLFTYDSVNRHRTYLFYEPEIKSDSSLFSDIYVVKPWEFAAYIQDKMEFENMVLNVGLRLDYFNPNVTYPTQPRNPSNSIRLTDPDKMSSLEDAPDHFQISPRIGLSYQLGEEALLRFAYGHFFQMPPFYSLYANHAHLVEPVNFATLMGNPLVKPQKTVQYEVGLWQQLMPKMGLEVAVFYRDIYDLLGTKIITTYDQISYGLYDNKDFGNVKGLELKLDWIDGPFSAFLNYTLQYTKGNADNPRFSFSRAGDKIDPVNKLIPMSWDQRHTLNISIGYNSDKFGGTVTAYYNSGTPYTWSPLDESPLSRINLFPNNSSKPEQVSVDLNAFYNLWSIDNYNLRLTLLVYNLLDTLNDVDVYGSTGKAYTSIIRENDRRNHRSDFNTYEDRVKNPAMYSAPRYVKLGLNFSF